MKTKKVIYNPRIIEEYSNHMIGVDKSVQFLSYYNFSRKTTVFKFLKKSKIVDQVI